MNPLRRTALIITITAIFVSHVSLALAQDEPSDRVVVHVVQSGESLDSIAAHYGIPPSIIRSTNALSVYDDIYPGQRLLIPLSQARQLDNSREVVTALDDSLYSLAYLYGVSPESLARQNLLLNPWMIGAGESIAVGNSASNSESHATFLDERGSLMWEAYVQNTNVYAILLRNDSRSLFSGFPEQQLLLPFAPKEQTEYPSSQLGDLALTPLPLEPGRVGVLRLITRNAGLAKATFLGQVLTLEASEDRLQHYAIIPIPYDTQPGQYLLSIEFADSGAKISRFEQFVRVADGRYPTESIRLAPDMAAVLSDPATVNSELAYILEVMTLYQPYRYWQGRMSLPTPGVMTSQFGALRSYNDGLFNAIHTGTDFGGKSGTPIFAPAGGVVVDIASLDIRGLVTIIDHGQGLYTGYWHQSSVLVSVGDVVSAGQQIGTIGNTGRSTAAHLHWEMRLKGIPVDPMQWVRQEIP